MNERMCDIDCFRLRGHAGEHCIDCFLGDLCCVHRSQEVNPVTAAPLWTPIRKVSDMSEPTCVYGRLTPKGPCGKPAVAWNESRDIFNRARSPICAEHAAGIRFGRIIPFERTEWKTPAPTTESEDSDE